MISTSDNCVLHFERSGNGHTVVHRASEWATFGVETMDALRSLSLFLLDP